ncbi:MAG TPA: hypothetical protein VI072_32400 [Polyangiaceae bacterium]
MKRHSALCLLAPLLLTACEEFTITVLYPAPGETVRSVPVPVTYAVLTNLPLRYECQLDTQPPSTCDVYPFSARFVPGAPGTGTAILVVEGLTEGPHAVSLTGISATSRSTATAQFTVDTRAPTIADNIDSAAASTTFNRIGL